MKNKKKEQEQQNKKISLDLQKFINPKFTFP